MKIDSSNITSCGDHPTPPPRSYWVIPGRLLAGAFPGAEDEAEAKEKLEALFESGIRCVVNLVELDEHYHIDYRPDSWLQYDSRSLR